MLTIGSSSAFEAAAAAAASSASAGAGGAIDRSAGGRAYISVADEGEDGESIFT